MRFRRAAILYNPTAGGARRRAARGAEEAACVLRGLVGEIEILATLSDRRADALAADAVAAGFDLIAPCGGDGTINETIQGMVGAQAALLPLPAGTANVFARETGTPRNPRLAAALLDDLVVKQVRLGAVEFPREGRTRYFLLMLGAGFDAGAVYRLSGELKKRTGVFAYMWSGVRRLAAPIETLRLRVASETTDCTLAVISKSRLYGGGFVLTPEAHLLSSSFDVIAFPSSSPLSYAGYLAGALSGTLARFRGVARLRADSIELTAEEGVRIWVQVDGELAGQLPAKVRLGPESVRLLLPRAYCESRLAGKGPGQGTTSALSEPPIGE